MNNEILGDAYWSNRYRQNQTGWDVGTISTPLKEYIDQLTDKNISILIPGCGNAYEAAYLLKNGFTNITLIDIAKVLVQQLKQKFSGSLIKVLHQDFFTHNGKYDLILEQTFFCALNIEFRKKYINKMFELLNDGGKLVGLLFDKHFEGGPPFGGNKGEYEKLFSEKFNLKVLLPAYNSIKPRKGTELFFIAERK